MYGDQYGEFVFGYWGLKGYNHAWHPPILEAHLGGCMCPYSEFLNLSFLNLSYLFLKKKAVWSLINYHHL